jgi:hypothetical protein
LIPFHHAANSERIKSSINERSLSPTRRKLWTEEQLKAAAEEAIEARRKQAEKDGKPFERRHITPTKRASK